MSSRKNIYNTYKFFLISSHDILTITFFNDLGMLMRIYMYIIQLYTSDKSIFSQHVRYY